MNAWIGTETRIIDRYESIGVVFGGGETEVRGERKGEAAEREAKEEA